MQIFSDSSEIADRIIAQVGPNIVLATPLGLGKANHIVNALYSRVASDSSLSLTILTALTPEKPVYGSELERRFMAPIVERLFGDYPEFQYALDRRNRSLPKNIRVEEFFFLAGSQLSNQRAQQDFICANYTHVLEYLYQRGVNVLAQLVSPPLSDSNSVANSNSFSASCNTDLTGDMLQARKTGKANFVLACQTNNELPYFQGDALIAEQEVDFLLDAKEFQFPLFAPPKAPVSQEEYAAAMHVASLIPDGGTLQIGIGSIADAVIQCLILRVQQPQRFEQILQQLCEQENLADRETDAFHDGLHGVSEMLVDSFLDLYDAGILKREVEGRVLHGAFFLGSKGFYQRLRDLPDSVRQKINMCSILYSNNLYGEEQAKRQQRVKARFVNKAMMATVLGEVISDGLENGTVISGVGGQYNFVAQAFALEDARSIIVLPATRLHQGEVKSNILWAYSHCTIPRHLRDVIVTEYGVADLRGKCDAAVIAEMLSVADSRFQAQLLTQAKRAGKLPADYKIPAQFQNNTPDSLSQILKDTTELFPPFPFGTDFTEVEQQLLQPLQCIKQVAHSKGALLKLAWRGVRSGSVSADAQEMLQRMDLLEITGLEARFYRWLLLGALNEASGALYD